jgi:hypothetical protein
LIFVPDFHSCGVFWVELDFILENFPTGSENAIHTLFNLASPVLPAEATSSGVLDEAMAVSLTMLEESFACAVLETSIKLSAKIIQAYG